MEVNWIPLFQKFYRIMTLVLIGAFALLLPLGAGAFSGEDLLQGKPWHHENITCRALLGDVQDCRWTDADEPVYEFNTGFSPHAAHAIAWHADYIDSYLYSPLWWASAARGTRPVRSVRKRYLAGMSNYWQLASLHFDDLNSAEDVEQSWRRYFSGTLVGLEWAAEQQDIQAAYNILGLSMHAVQDFYSHSTWINDPVLRKRTFLETSPARRARASIMTGAYERKHAPVQHGKYSFACSIYEQRPAKGALDMMCANIVPTANLSFCEDYRACNQGTRTRTEIELFGGTPNMVVLHPPGIAMDNSMLARVGADMRGLTGSKNERRPSSTDNRFPAIGGVSIPRTPLPPIGGSRWPIPLPPSNGETHPIFDRPGEASRIEVDDQCAWIIANGDPCEYESDYLFASAKNLAVITSNQWIRLIDRHMQNRHPEFWENVKQCRDPLANNSCPGRFNYAKPPRPITDNFEKYSKFPFQFLSAGHDQPVPSYDERGWFLRLEVKTAGAHGSGTDADITVLGPDGEEFILDYLPLKDPNSPVRSLLGYNDLEKNDRQTYTVGPFRRMPDELVIFNNAAKRSDVRKAFFRQARDRMKSAFNNARRTFRNMQDYVGFAEWTPEGEELYQATEAGTVEKIIRVDGGAEGVYDFYFRVERTDWQGDGVKAHWSQYRVTLDNVFTVKESKVDGATRSDEPFFFVGLTSYGLTSGQWIMRGPYSSIDKGDWITVNYPFGNIELPSGGMLGIVIEVWESDKERGRDRRALFNDFQGNLSEGDIRDYPEFFSEWGTRLGGAWKVQSITAYAFRRGYTQEYGKVLEMTEPTWLQEDETKSWLLNTAGVQGLGPVSSSFITMDSVKRQYRVILPDYEFTPNTKRGGE